MRRLLNSPPLPAARRPGNGDLHGDGYGLRAYGPVRASVCADDAGLRADGPGLCPDGAGLRADSTGRTDGPGSAPRGFPPGIGPTLGQAGS
jgi:hypothetical protein